MAKMGLMHSLVQLLTYSYLCAHVKDHNLQVSQIATLLQWRVMDQQYMQVILLPQTYDKKMMDHCPSMLMLMLMLMRMFVMHDC
jgi:hypothetical protein